MKIIVKQRFPNLVSGSALIEAECSSIEEIYNIPFIDRWMNEPTFYRFYKSTGRDNRHLLICETNKGKNYWVIAFMYGDVNELNLPEWKK